jgi:hypothetical protein
VLRDEFRGHAQRIFYENTTVQPEEIAALADATLKRQADLYYVKTCKSCGYWTNNTSVKFCGNKNCKKELDPIEKQRMERAMARQQNGDDEKQRLRSKPKVKSTSRMLIGSIPSALNAGDGGGSGAGTGGCVNNTPFSSAVRSVCRRMKSSRQSGGRTELTVKVNYLGIFGHGCASNCDALDIIESQQNRNGTMNDG